MNRQPEPREDTIPVRFFLIGLVVVALFTVALVLL